MASPTYVSVLCIDGMVVAVPVLFATSGILARYMHATTSGEWHSSCMSALLLQLQGAFYCK
jgi:hypothetical protein